MAKKGGFAKRSGNFGNPEMVWTFTNLVQAAVEPTKMNSVLVVEAFQFLVWGKVAASNLFGGLDVLIGEFTQHISRQTPVESAGDKISSAIVLEMREATAVKVFVFHAATGGMHPAPQ